MDPKLSILEHVVKPGTVEHGTAEHGMPEHQIWNSKTRNANSGTPTWGTVLLDRITKSGIVKHGKPNLEKCLWTMRTLPLREKNITVRHLEMARENNKRVVMTTLCQTKKTTDNVI